jgi:hypothetical protein
MAHKTKESREKTPPAFSSPKVSNKKGSTLPNKAQNTKHQNQDWMPKE